MKDDDEEDHCIINVSPIGFGHCLYVPKVKKGQPQILTRDSIKSALQLMLLSRSKSFKIGIVRNVKSYVGISKISILIIFFSFQLLTASVLMQVSTICIGICTTWTHSLKYQYLISKDVLWPNISLKSKTILPKGMPFKWLKLSSWTSFQEKFTR